jgi:hypothetical protein
VYILQKRRPRKKEFSSEKIAIVTPFINYESEELNPPKEMFEDEGATVIIVSSERELFLHPSRFQIKMAF